MTQVKSHQRTNSSDKVDTVAQLAALRVDELLSELGIRYSKGGNKYIGCCPIHGGKNFGAWNLYPDGHSVPGYWKCRSHHCQETFKATIIGFTRGVLSHQQYNWEKKGDKTVTFPETLNWLCKFIGQDFDNIQVDTGEIERRRFTAQVDAMCKATAEKNAGIPRELVKQNLEIPASYYVERGFSPIILTSYDVGLCNKHGKEMYNRVVVPVYDETRQFMIGCTGRSIYKVCGACNAYHAPTVPCPSADKRWLHPKWKNADNFLTGTCLYNYCNAKKYIQESGVAILVEGPPDVWRLEECGIHNAVALFGCDISEEQQIILESSGAMSVIILLDNDEAGKEGAAMVKRKLERLYNIVTPKISSHDVGDMTCELVNKEIVPVVDRIKQRSKVIVF